MHADSLCFVSYNEQGISYRLRWNQKVVRYAVQVGVMTSNFLNSGL